MLVTTAMVFFAGCGLDIDEALGTLESQVEDLEDRVSALERQCKKMNENILSLQTIVDGLQEGMTVSSVKTITDSDGTEVGYTITFSNSTTITIHNGADGKDGADGEDGTDGKDGYVPTIGVKQHTDSYYYWTIDGEWLLDDNGQKLRAVGVDGADGEDGEDGADGSDGANGSDGADGVTPQLEIRDGYWWVSYNGGTSWQQLGKATGDDGADGSDGAGGIDGSDGVDGISLFQSVTWDEKCVYFTILDGTIITVPLSGAVISFIVDVLEVGTTTFSAMVSTSDNTTWIPWVQSKQYVNPLRQAGDDALFQKDLEYIEYLADCSEVSLEEYVARILITGSYQVDYTQLQPETEYVFYVYGLSPDGQRTTPIVYQEFTTHTHHSQTFALYKGRRVAR